MKGFSAWPGKVDMPPDYLKRPTIKKVMHCVFFFGTYDYGWIPEHDLKPYQEFKDKMMSSKKSVKKAVDEIELCTRMHRARYIRFENRCPYSLESSDDGYVS